MKHIENRNADYLNRKLIIVEEVLERNNAGDITKFYGFIARADGDVSVEGTPINKDTLKFIRKGYKVAVPKTEKPWVVHDCGLLNMNDYDDEREKFVKEYLRNCVILTT